MQLTCKVIYKTNSIKKMPQINQIRRIIFRKMLGMRFDTSQIQISTMTNFLFGYYHHSSFQVLDIIDKKFLFGLLPSFIFPSLKSSLKMMQYFKEIFVKIMSFHKLKQHLLYAIFNGIISFHHGDNDFYRGGPPGFWEIINKETRTGFIIQRLVSQ